MGDEGGGEGGGVRSMLLIALRCFLKDPLLALCLLDYRANFSLLFFFVFGKYIKFCHP